MKNKSEAVRESLTHSQVDKEAGKLIKITFKERELKNLPASKQPLVVPGKRVK